MNIEEKIKQLFDQVIEKYNGNKSAAAESLGVNVVTFWGWVKGSRSMNKALLGAIDRAGGILIIPGDPAPGQSMDAEDLIGKVRELEKQVDELKEYKAKYEAARELVAIMSGNKPQPQQVPLPEPESKRRIA